jgi:hypothetical protein
MAQVSSIGAGEGLELEFMYLPGIIEPLAFHPYASE